LIPRLQDERCNVVSDNCIPIRVLGIVHHERARELGLHFRAASTNKVASLRKRLVGLDFCINNFDAISINDVNGYAPFVK
jgi:hypothetical protein